MILRAKYVAPMSEPVIENGAVTIETGRVVHVGPFEKPRAVSADIVDHGDAILLPAFVNAHTHLELSGMAGSVPPQGDVISWLRRLMKARSRVTSDETTAAEAMRAGIEQSLRAGVTTVGDVTTQPEWTRPILARSFLRSVSFGEVTAIGQRRSLLERRLSAAAVSDWASPRLRLGISPHSPYTVEPAALGRCTQTAARMNARLCIHLLEIESEAEFTQSGAGPLRDFLRDLSVWDERVPVCGCDPVEWLARGEALHERLLAAHVNYVTDEQIVRLARAGVSVAYCPRTHGAFKHPPHRFVDMLAAGVNVCIGTDSLASTPSLSVLDELRWLHQQRPDVPVEVLLSMATHNGAKALGFAGEVGTIHPRAWADLVVVALPGSGRKQEPLTAMLESQGEVVMVYAAGRKITDAGLTPANAS